MKAKRLFSGMLAIWLFSMPISGWSQFNFSSPIPVISYDTVYGMSFGDLDHDGFADMVLGTNLGVSVSHNNGDGTFEFPMIYSTASRLTVVADMNGDGALDVVAVASNRITIWLGNGDGTLSEGTESPGLGSQPYQVAPIDFNGDGDLDLLVSGYPENGMVIFYGAGDGTVAKHVDLPVAADLVVGGIAEADFNEDGNADFATMAFDPEGKESRITVALGDGSGDFLGLQNFAASATGMPVGDLNGDGHVDLATCPVILGAGDGTFVIQDMMPPCGGEGLADFNGDGHLDTYREGLAVVMVAAGLGDGTFAPAETFQTGTGPDGIVELHGGQVAFGPAPDIVVFTRAMYSKITLLANELTIDAIFANGFD